MAGEEKKPGFPVIPNAHWWALRKKFRQTIPGVVTPNYLASVLNMKLQFSKPTSCRLSRQPSSSTEWKPLDRASGYGRPAVQDRV
jgi:hypothetical protein